MDTTNSRPPSPKGPMRGTGYIVAGLLIFIITVMVLGFVSAIN